MISIKVTNARARQFKGSAIFSALVEDLHSADRVHFPFISYLNWRPYWNRNCRKRTKTVASGFGGMNIQEVEVHFGAKPLGCPTRWLSRNGRFERAKWAERGRDCGRERKKTMIEGCRRLTACVWVYVCASMRDANVQYHIDNNRFTQEKAA